MATQGRRFRRRKKEDVFVEGSFIDQLIGFDPGLDRQEETFHLFGFDSPELDVQHNQGSAQLTVMDKYTSNAIMDLVTGNDPSSTAVRQYNVNDLTSVTLWANIKDLKNTRYVKSILIQGWTPGMPLPSGDPNAKAQYQITGNSSLPRQFEGAWITAKKIASSASSVHIGATPVEVPNEPNIFALSIRALNAIVGPPAVLEQEEIVPTAGMLAATGLFSTAAVAAAMTLTTITHSYVLILQTGTGVYPATAQNPTKLNA